MPHSGPCTRGNSRNSDQRGGGGVRQQQAGGAQVGAQRTLRRGEADQRAGHRQQRHAHQGRGGDALRVEQVGHDQEVAQEGHHGAVAVRAHLEQLQAGEQHQQHDARRAAEQRAVLDIHGGERQGRHRQQQPARRQGRAAQANLRAPGVQAEREQGQPPGHAQGVRTCHQDEREQQTGKVAQRHGAHFRGERVGNRHAAEYSASACRQALRCASPLSGASSRPGRRRP